MSLFLRSRPHALLFRPKTKLGCMSQDDQTTPGPVYRPRQVSLGKACAEAKQIIHILPMQECDASKETSYVRYLDCNNLYGYAMSEPLPTGGFTFLAEKELEVFDLTTKSDEDAIG